MSEKRKKQVIKDIKHTIQTETNRVGGNMDLVAKLTAVLESVENGTYVSKLKKKRKK